MSIRHSLQVFGEGLTDRNNVGFMKNIIIIGATSAISQSVAKQLLAEDVCFHLVARNKDKLDIVANDLLARGCSNAICYHLDFNDLNEHTAFVDMISKNVEIIDTLFICYGIMHSQQDCEVDVTKAIEQVNSNYVSTVSLLVLFSELMATQSREGNGATIAVVSSVAGDRGRKSNFVYGSAKAGLTVFLEGLRYKLYTKGINVLTIKPGFVDSPMTADINKGALWVSTDRVAQYIVKGIEKKKSVIYIPTFWFFIMAIIKIIPTFIFRKLNI